MHFDVGRQEQTPDILVRDHQTMWRRLVALRTPKAVKEEDRASDPSLARRGRTIAGCSVVRPGGKVLQDGLFEKDYKNPSNSPNFAFNFRYIPHPASQLHITSLKLNPITMKTFAIAATLALLASSTIAAPAVKAARQFEAQITFHGATPDDTFTQSVPTDGSTFYVCRYQSRHLIAQLPCVLHFCRFLSGKFAVNAISHSPLRACFPYH